MLTNTSVAQQRCPLDLGQKSMLNPFSVLAFTATSILLTPPPMVTMQYHLTPLRFTVSLLPSLGTSWCPIRVSGSRPSPTPLPCRVPHPNGALETRVAVRVPQMRISGTPESAEPGPYQIRRSRAGGFHSLNFFDTGECASKGINIPYFVD